jgi:hypothetical protein
LIFYPKYLLQKALASPLGPAQGFLGPSPNTLSKGKRKVEKLGIS